jgi:hypothetical protein
MTLPNESEVLDRLSEMIVKAGANLFKATKYLYAFTDNYFNCSIRDFFFVILSDIFNADKLSAFQISVDDGRCDAVNARAYFDVYRMIVYSLAIRLPLLCRTEDGRFLSAKQINTVYEKILEKGIEKKYDAIDESYEEIMAASKKGKTIAPYSSQWYRAYILSAIPELAEINNRNMFFFGSADMLFSLYYICLEEEFGKYIGALS